jgi:hypothetical protein
MAAVQLEPWLWALITNSNKSMSFPDIFLHYFEINIE